MALEALDKKISTRISSKLFQKLENYCNINSLRFSEVFRNALKSIDNKCITNTNTITINGKKFEVNKIFQYIEDGFFVTDITITKELCNDLHDYNYITTEEFINSFYEQASYLAANLDVILSQEAFDLALFVAHNTISTNSVYKIRGLETLPYVLVQEGKVIFGYDARHQDGLPAVWKFIFGIVLNEPNPATNGALADYLSYINDNDPTPIEIRNFKKDLLLETPGSITNVDTETNK